jgi:hypothetical protein
MWVHTRSHTNDDNAVIPLISTLILTPPLDKCQYIPTIFNHGR